jgi:hypothetical protein
LSGSASSASSAPHSICNRSAVSMSMPRHAARGSGFAQQPRYPWPTFLPLSRDDDEGRWRDPGAAWTFSRRRQYRVYS